MAENLNYETDGSFCYDESANCRKYGRLYSWAAAMDSAGIFSNAGRGCGSGVTCGASGIIRGVCPKGWHLPNKTEWQTLRNFVERDQGLSSNTVSTHLKARSGWELDSGTPKGLDTYGFSALPAAPHYFSTDGYSTYFWSASENCSYYAYYWYLGYNGENFNDHRGGKHFEFSVRCLRD